MNKGGTVSRAANKLKREVLRLPGVRALREHQHYRMLEEHSLALPPLDPRDLPILHALRRDGTHREPVESLGLPLTTKMLESLGTLVGELRAIPKNNGSNAPRLPLDRLYEFPEIYMWGLDERLLNLVENYIGLPIRYHGADLRREIADGVADDVRQWHIDNEDRRMFKVIMYLNDVEPGGGPFEYMTRSRSVEVARELHYGSGFVPDDVLVRVAPKNEWLEAIAPANTAVFADTCRIFHRAQAPRLRDRYSVTFSWTSTTAVKTYATIPLTPKARSYVVSHTSERQRACLPAQLV